MSDSLGHPARVQIMRLFVRREAFVCGDIVDELPLAQSTVSHHLEVLEEAGVVKGEIDGPRVCCCVEPRALRRIKALIGSLQARRDVRRPVWHRPPMTRASFEVKPFPRNRHDIVDALEVGVRRHMVHALLELDVTRARELIRDREARAGERLSFTAFVVASLARAIDADRRLHAYRDWRGRLVLFDEVDVVTLVESEVDEVAIPHVVRAANRRTVREIHDEIRRVQASPGASAQRSGFLARLSRFTPGLLRRLFFRVLRRAPHWLKRTAGTTLVTSVGMFGIGSGWAVGIVPLHTLCLTVGGIARKPGLVDGRVEPREILSLTASIDHDIVDGAPAARFARRLRELVEGGEVLQDAAR